MRILILGLALLLSGCASTPTVESPRPVPTNSETIPRAGVEELAVTAVTDYFNASALVAADGGADPNRIANVVTARWLPNEIAGFATLRELGTRQLGAPTITKIEATSVRGIAAVSEVVVHVCTALDGVSVVADDFGEDLTPDGTTLVSVFVVPEGGVMKVDGVQPWTDATWCAAP